MFWEERQQMRQLEAEGFRNQQVETSGRTNNPAMVASPQPISSNKGTTSTSAHVALVNVATHTLESLADVLEQNPGEIPMKDRSDFAKAIHRAMQALAAAKN